MIIQPFHVRFDELNVRGEIPAATMLKYFQEAAGLDSESMGFGWQELQKENLAWVLMHMQLKPLAAHIERQPVKIKTWHAFSDKLFSRREFEVLDRQDKPLMQGSSWWVLMDTQKRRIARSPQRLLDLNPQTPHFLLEAANFKTPLPQTEPVSHFRVRARLEDLDINGHVNNTHYAAWAVESVPESVRSVKQLDEMLLAFKNECRHNEHIHTDVYPESENAFWHVLTRESDGKEAARVYTRWK